MRVTLDRLPPGFRSKWRASAELFGVMFCAYGNTKDEAVESIRPKLLDYKQYFRPDRNPRGRPR